MVDLVGVKKKIAELRAKRMQSPAQVKEDKKVRKAGSKTTRLSKEKQQKLTKEFREWKKEMKEKGVDILENEGNDAA